MNGDQCYEVNMGSMTIICSDPKTFGEIEREKKIIKDEQRKKYPKGGSEEPENDNTIYVCEGKVEGEDIIETHDPLVEAKDCGFNWEDEPEGEVKEPEGEGSNEFVSKTGGEFPENSVIYGAGTLIKGKGYMRYEIRGEVFIITDTPAVLKDGLYSDISGTDEEMALKQIHELYFNKKIDEEYREDFLRYIIGEIDKEGADILSNTGFQDYLEEEVTQASRANQKIEDIMYR